MRKQAKKLGLDKQHLKVLTETSLVVVQGGNTCPTHGCATKVRCSDA
jgi:hypothetical protein